MALSHIVMQLVLCNAATRLKTQASLPVRVAVVDKLNRHVADETVRVAASGATDGTVEFDIPWGVYLAQASLHAGRTTCTQSQVFSVLPGHNRQLRMQLQHGNTGMPVPVIINGELPSEFAYAQPTVVIFGKGAKCNSPVGTPLAANIDQQDDDQAYYASIYPNAALLQDMPAIPALRLTDSSGGYHYVKIPSDFLDFKHPGQAQYDVKDELIDLLAGKPEDTLLCVRTYETTTETH